MESPDEMQTGADVVSLVCELRRIASSEQKERWWCTGDGKWGIESDMRYVWTQLRSYKETWSAVAMRNSNPWEGATLLAILPFLLLRFVVEWLRQKSSVAVVAVKREANPGAKQHKAREEPDRQRTKSQEPAVVHLGGHLL